MVSERTAKLMSILPEGLVVFLSRKILNWYIRKNANLTIYGQDNLKKIKSPVIFICNHLSNADALILGKVLKEADPTFVAGIKLTGNAVTNLGMKITKTIGIKPNTADKEAISKTIKALKEGNNILMFPEGTRSRKAELLEAKRGIVLIARMANAKIVPVALRGTEKLYPINDDDMGKEDFCPADVFVSIGEPVELPKRNEGEEKHKYEDRVTYYLMKGIANLLPEDYRGFYKEDYKE